MDTKFFGRNQPGGLFSIVDRQNFPTGDIWWVDSGNTGHGSNGAGFGKNPDAPMLTWVYAVSQAAAGDQIFLMPGHTETIGITGAAAITLSKAGLQTIGLGGRTLKPQILIDGYDDTYISVTAADITLENIAFSSGHADVAAGIVLAPGSPGFTMRNCQMLENTASENFLVSVAAQSSDDMLIEGCTFYGVTQATECIELVGVCSRTTIRNNLLSGLFSVSAISAITTLSLAIEIDNNRIFNGDAGTAEDLAGAIDLITGTTGMVTNNTIYYGDNTDCLTSIDADACGRGGNVAANEYDQEAFHAATQSA